MKPTEGRLRVLLIAYACSPEVGGEHLLGWEWARRLAERHDVTVLTSSARLSQIRERRPPSLRLIGVDDRRFRFWKRLGRAGFYAYYARWQREAARHAVVIMRESEHHVIHQLTLHTWRFPNPLAWTSDRPFVWGPIAGLESVPLRMIPGMGWDGFGELVRSLSNRTIRMSRGVRRALSRASAVLVSNEVTRCRLMEAHPREYHLLPANGVDAAGLPAWNPGAGFELVAAGRMVRIRPYDLVLQALMRLAPQEAARITMVFLGDGPDRRWLEQMATSPAMRSRVEFAGAIPRSQALERMSRAHLLVFPSLRDSGGSALAEAMAMGLPSLAFRLGGPGELLSDGGGFLVEAKSRAAVVRGIRDLLSRLLQRRDLLTAESARAKTVGQRRFDWDWRIETVDRMYREAMSHRESSVLQVEA